MRPKPQLTDPLQRKNRLQACAVTSASRICGATVQACPTSGSPGRSRRLLPPRRALRLGRPRLHPHLGARAGPEHHFLINPYGMLFDEITASSLVKVDARGEKVDAEPLPGEPGGLRHPQRDPRGAPRRRLRPAHAHARGRRRVGAEGRASCRSRSRRPSRSRRSATTTTRASRCATTRSRGSCATSATRRRLILRNHGLLTVGATIADAFLAMYVLQRACEIQVLAQAGGGELVTVDPPIVAGVKANVAAVTKGAGRRPRVARALAAARSHRPRLSILTSWDCRPYVGRLLLRLFSPQCLIKARYSADARTGLSLGRAETLPTPEKICKAIELQAISASVRDTDG